MYIIAINRWALEVWIHNDLTLYQPMTHICVMSSHKPIRIYMGGLILGVNTRLFCFFKLFLMVGKGLTATVYNKSIDFDLQAQECLRKIKIPFMSTT